MDFSHDSTNLCVACVDDKRFAEWIEQRGHSGQCDFDATHGNSRKTISIEAFAEHVDEFFRKIYQQGEEQQGGEPYGDPYKEILKWELGCDDESLIDAIADNLPDNDCWDGGDAFYDDCSNYERKSIAEKRHKGEEAERIADEWYGRRYTYQWRDFCDIVKYKRRFIGIKNSLDELFGLPEEYDNGRIKPRYKLKLGQKIYRARIFDKNFTYENLAESPARELNAPPKAKAMAGRMNVEFIPVFYAAFSEITALNEIHPGIGDTVAVGEFTVQREIEVFDFTVFDKRNTHQTLESSAHTRYDFITQLHDEISKPIMPHEKCLEYISTQIIAEYLKEIFRCDAIIYKSSLRKNGDDDNRNIVIINNETGFVGDDSFLSYSKHTINMVEDVIYKTNDISFPI